MQKSRSKTLMTLQHMRELSEEELQDILMWVDSVPLTMDKKNLARDFSDGVALAEIVKYFVPKFMNQCPQPSYGTKAKESNWFYLNRKCFEKFRLDLHPDVIHALAVCKPWIIENVLVAVRSKIDQHLYHQFGDFSSHNVKASDTSVSNRIGDNGCNGLMDSTNMSFSSKRSEAIMHEVEYLQRKQIQEQNKTIRVLMDKVKRLESIIQLKDIQLDDCTKKLETFGKNRSYYVPLIPGREEEKPSGGILLSTLPYSAKNKCA